jgi:hypothetical protein
MIDKSKTVNSFYGTLNGHGRCHSTEVATEIRGGRTNEGRGKPIPEIMFGEGIPSEGQPTP